MGLMFYGIECNDSLVFFPGSLVKTSRDLTYENLRDKTLEIAERCASYSNGKIEQVLEIKVDRDFLEKWKRLTSDSCYSKDICSLLGVDYLNIYDDDYNRIKVFALEFLNSSSDGILPLL